MSDESAPRIAPPILVVVDTSILRKVAGNLDRGDWPILKAASRLGLFSLHIPLPVLQELTDHHRRDLRQLVKLEAEAAALRRRLYSEVNSHEPTLPTTQVTDEALEEYARIVSDWFSESGSVLKEPSVAHGELVKRILDGRKPFTESERGYRDALIWYSTLECAATGETILLTANTKDFGEVVQPGASPVLASDLVADLVNLDLPKTRVALMTSTAEVLNRFLPDWTESQTASAWRALLGSENVLEQINEILDARLGARLAFAVAPESLWDVGLRAILALESVQSLRLVEDQGGWYQVQTQMTVAGQIGGYRWGWAGPDGDSDELILWDDWGGLIDYFLIERPRLIQITLTARFKPLTEIRDFDVANATELHTSGEVDVVDDLFVAKRSLRALLGMLRTYANDPAFLEAMFGDYHDEFVTTAGGAIRDWEQVADLILGRYPALVVDNLPTVLAEPSGLRALIRDLESALEAMSDR